jgi:probable biosynthetic protein (TIGR04098 family)
MPQMALAGLSEAWLFKELGDIHWAMITDFLKSPSSAISDDAGDRLYATFTRISIDVQPQLRAFLENDPLAINSRLERYGASFFFGHHDALSDRARCSATTMSTFAKYGERGTNTSLMKGSPTLVDADALPSLTEFPAYGLEYRQRRASERDDCLFECEYEILPPHDINGVGLLYFAAYPVIFDLCLERYEGKGFLMAHSTVRKDVLYFANSEPTDTLVFRLHAREEAGGRIDHVCSLSRKSDGKRMAEVTASKQRIIA